MFKPRALLATVLLAGTCVPALAQDGSTVDEGRTVSLEYTVSRDDGSVVFTNVGGEPLVYKHGEGRLLPKLEAALLGMKAEETRKLVLSPGDAYGEIDENARRRVDLADLPENSREVGALLIARDEAGNQRQVRVHAIEGEQAVVDYNHPLAGETVHFTVRILGVQ